MEFSNPPLRIDPATSPASMALRQPPGALSAQAETTRPVLAAEQSTRATPATSEGFEPLDTFEVGDNDLLPVPPEPPRKAAVLAIMATAPEVETPEEPPVPVEALSQTLRDMDTGPANPTVDIRS